MFELIDDDSGVLDESDRATRVEMRDNQLAIELARRNATAGPEATGACLNCGEELSDGRRWCNFECCQDYDKRQRRH